MEPKNILIVEDEEDIRDSLRQALELEGYQVTTAADGKEGLQVLRAMKPPCLILLDLMMPIMDGPEFLKIQSCDQKLSSIPTIVVSAMPDLKKTSSATAFIKKPLELDHLFRVIEKYCCLPKTKF